MFLKSKLRKQKLYLLGLKHVFIVFHVHFYSFLVCGIFTCGIDQSGHCTACGYRYSIHTTLIVQSLCVHTPNPVKYLDFGDNISLLGIFF